MNVVLVDDDAAVRKSLRLLPTGRGHAVDLYAGDDGVLEAKLNGSAPTCLMADYLMPNIDGMTLLGRLRKQFNATLEQHALAVGYSQVLEKPLSHERLLDAVACLKAAL